MSTFMHMESRRSYSWWWDSHISPKNSKWLQENLTDMDLKVKAMIKLIEEDADSFAKRAEMYYKKRPELMKFVEDFYRAYRALAERYDHATGALRHAQQTIAEAFPNQTLPTLADESPSTSPSTEMGLCTPEMPSPLRPLFDSDDLQKDVWGGPGYFNISKRNAAFAEENESFATKKGLKQLNEMLAPQEAGTRVKLHEGKVRKGLNFQEEEESISQSKVHIEFEIISGESKEIEILREEIKHLQEEVSRLSIENQNLKNQIASESMDLDSSRSENQNLRDAITKLQSEKEASLLHDQLQYEKISNLETELFKTEYEFGKAHEEFMVGIVKLCSAEERCLSLEKANQCLILELEQSKKVLDEIIALSGDNHSLLEQAVKEKENAKNEINLFHEQLSLVSNENQSLKAQVLSETKHLQLFRAEIKNLRASVSKLEYEKAAAIRKIQLSQESIYSLSAENFHANDEIGKLLAEILMGIVKLCTIEEQYIALEKEDQRLKLELDERKKLLEEIQLLSVESQNLLEQEVKEKKIIKNEMEFLQGEVSQHSIEKQHMMSQILSKSQHLDAYKTEVQNLRNTISVLECEKDDAVSKNQHSLESISCLESEIFRAKEEIGKLHEEVLMGIVKLCGAEEQYLALENASQNLKLEVEEKKAMVENLRIFLQESDKQRIEAERSLQSLERLYNLSLEKVEHMALEIQILFEKLEVTEHGKMGLEVEMRHLEDENYSLNEHIHAYDSKLELLEDEIASLEEINSKLEFDINIHLEDNKLLQQEFDFVKDDRDELSSKHKGLTEQLEVASLNMESLEVLIKELQFGCAELKEGCRKLEDEKLLLSNKLQNMEGVSERNAFLESTLSDAVEKIRVLEDSCKSLNARDSKHAVEKASLISHAKVMDENLEKISEKNSYLKNSLADVNTELEESRIKLNEYEESIEFLSDQNSNLLLQNNALASQVESIHFSLKNSEETFALLEVSHLNLEKEKKESVAKVLELENVLNIKMKEHDSLMQSSKNCLLSLENQIHLLEEDRRLKEDGLEEVQKEFITYIVEILVLQRCLYDMKDSFRTEKLKLDSLVQSGEIQQAAVESQINHLLEKGQAREEEFEAQEQKYMNSMLEIFVLQRCLSEMKEKSFILLHVCQKHIEASRCAGDLISQLEGSKLLEEENTLLVNQYARQHGIDLLMESLDINKKLVITDGSAYDFLKIILGEINNLLACISGTNDENLLLHLQLSVFHIFLEQNILEKVFLAQEIGRMHSQQLNFQRVQDQLSERCQKLGQDANGKERLNESLMDKLESLCRHLSVLSKDFSKMREEKWALEEENNAILEEAVTLELLYVFLRNEHVKEIRESKEKMKVVEIENQQLKDSLALLEELRSRTTMLEFDMLTTRHFCEELILQVEIEENLLKEKSMEFLKAHHKLQCAQMKITELCTKLHAANKEVDEAKMIQLQFEEKVTVLLEGHTCKDAEIINTREENRMLNEKLNRLNVELEVLRKREQCLSSELQKKICELDMCGGEITNLLFDVQVSAVNGAVLEDKMLELEGHEICSLVQREMFIDEIKLRNSHAFKFQKKLDYLENENRALKDIWNSCLPLFISLENCIATVENHAYQLANLQEPQDIPSSDPGKDNVASKGDIVTVELHSLVSKIEALDKLMLLTKNQLNQERMLHASNLEFARREIEGLKLKTSDKLAKQGVETSRGKDGGQLMKDIQLDQVSNSNAPSRIQSAESEDQMLKLWETAERDYGNLVSNSHGIAGMQELNNEHNLPEIVAEKEVGVDKIEISAELKDSQEDWNTRVIERLSTSAEKLSALKTTARNLRAKVENSHKCKIQRFSEHNAMETKLKQAEEGILLLADTDSKLRKKVEEYSKSSNGEKMRWLDRRQVSEQVLIILDQIEKLELDLQEVYYFFVAYDEEAENNRTRAGGDRTPRVLLRHYIQGWRVGQARKRGHFCWCVKPKAQE